MNTEQQDQDWLYFMGAEGNAKEYDRTKCQWFHEHGDGKWRRCFENKNYELPEFEPSVKYRRKKA